MEDNPEPLTRYRSDVPEKLQEIVFELLEKDKELRFQSAEGVIANLKRLMYDSSQSGYSRILTTKPKKTKPIVAGIAAIAVIVVAAALYTIFGLMSDRPQSGDTVPMIAVRPFDNLGSPEDDYFADGMTEEITSRLASIKGLGVISRTSSVKFRESEKTIQEIGRDYGVDFVLEGSVRWSKTGDQSRVRITPQLIRVSDDRHLWANNYERALMEVFAVQADIAEKIVEQLGLTLLESDRQNLAKIPTENPEAYQFYLKALQEFRGRADHSGAKTAQALLDSATALDPSFALAHALRSEAYSSGAGDSPDSESGKTALEAAKRALELEPELPEGHLALGQYYYFVEADDDRALEHFSTAKAGLSSDPELLDAISIVQVEQEKLEEALRNRRKAAQIDPLNARRHARLASILQSLRRFDEAEHSLNRAIALNPEAQTYYENKIDCLIARYGDIEKVMPVISEALKHCDTTKFVIKNSWITRYIPDLQTDSIIANYIQKQTADTSEHYIFHGRQLIFYRHLDILENYDDEARKLAGRWGGIDGLKGLLYSFFGECEQAVKYGLMEKESLSINKRYLRDLSRIMIVLEFMLIAENTTKRLTNLNLCSSGDRYNCEYSKI